MRRTKPQKRRKKGIYILYTVFLFLWSVSIAWMPVVSAQKEWSKIPMFVSGGSFWVGLIGTVVMALIISQSGKRRNGDRDTPFKIGQLGLVRFFQNRNAKIVDIVMFVSIGCIVIAHICTDNLYLFFSFLALFAFSFGMHCVLNGKNYNLSQTKRIGAKKTHD